MDNLEMENQFAEDNTFYRLIDRLEDTVDGAKNAPFSNDKAAVSRNELNEIIEGMRLNLPREVKQAQRIVGQAHSIIDSWGTFRLTEEQKEVVEELRNIEENPYFWEDIEG